MNDITTEVKLTLKDFTSDQEVRWCPGCGDYAILKCMQRTLPTLGATKENTVFVSGIGCSSRFPYYMETYGFHTIHGRAPAIATGLKLSNPELDVWVVTGDGDGLSIGGNHMLHVLRRNVDLNILLFNNKIYGLTKGQFSPTSDKGLRTPSSPLGNIDPALNPLSFALGSGARFVARTIDTAQKHMPGVFEAAHSFKGAALVEILQNCIVYNDEAWSKIAEKKTAAEHQLHLEEGEPMIFGIERDKGIAFDAESFSLKVVPADDAGVLTHNPKNLGMARMLVELGANDGEPMAMGVIYSESLMPYEKAVLGQVTEAESASTKTLKDLMYAGETWTVD